MRRVDLDDVEARPLGAGGRLTERAGDAGELARLAAIVATTALAGLWPAWRAFRLALADGLTPRL